MNLFEILQLTKKVYSVSTWKKKVTTSTNPQSDKKSKKLCDEASVKYTDFTYFRFSQLKWDVQIQLIHAIE